MVGQGDRRQRRHGAVAERRAHVDEPANVRRLAAHGEVVEHVGVGAVEQEADDVVGRPLAVVDHAGLGVAVLAGEERVVACAAVEAATRDRSARPCSASTVGRHVDEPAAVGHDALLLHPGTGDDERRTRLHDVDRTVLAAVAALVLPVVGRGVDRDQVGRGGRVEQLRHLLVGERVGVGRARSGYGLARSSSSGENRSIDWSAKRVAPLDLLDRRTPSRAVASARRKRTRPSTEAAS